MRCGWSRGAGGEGGVEGGPRRQRRHGRQRRRGVQVCRRVAAGGAAGRAAGGAAAVAEAEKVMPPTPAAVAVTAGREQHDAEREQRTDKTQAHARIPLFRGAHGVRHRPWDWLPVGGALRAGGPPGGPARGLGSKPPSRVCAGRDLGQRTAAGNVAGRAPPARGGALRAEGAGEREGLEEEGPRGSHDGVAPGRAGSNFRREMGQGGPAVGRLRTRWASGGLNAPRSPGEG